MKQLNHIFSITSRTAALLALVLTIVWLPVSQEKSSGATDKLSFSKNEHGLVKDFAFVSLTDQTEESTEDQESLECSSFVESRGICFAMSHLSELMAIDASGHNTGLNQTLPVYLQVRSLRI